VYRLRRRRRMIMKKKKGMSGIDAVLVMIDQAVAAAAAGIALVRPRFHPAYQKVENSQNEVGFVDDKEDYWRPRYTRTIHPPVERALVASLAGRREEVGTVMIVII
jgi:hypothetical protein